MVHVCIYIGIVQKKNMIKYPKANLADMLHSDSSICILLVLKNIINGKVNLADVLHSDLSIYIYIYILVLKNIIEGKANLAGVLHSDSSLKR